MPEDETKPNADAGPVDCKVGRVRINVGAAVAQDMAFGRWPATRAGGDVDPDMVFDAEWNAGVGYWDCRADGYGRRTWKGEAGGYGNGSIFAFGRDSVTLLDDAPNAEVTGAARR
jgi:hypothetical protein